MKDIPPGFDHGQKVKREPQPEHKKRNIFVIIVFICVVSVMYLIIHQGTGKKISPYLTANGTQLIDQGNPYSFVGVNTYQVASFPPHNTGCGGPITDINAFFATLRPNSMIRMWAWQGGMATNPKTKQLDWTGIDRVLAAAKKYHQRVIVSLGSQSGTCDDGLWKDSAWYQGGYKNSTNPSGLTPLSYWDYVQKIVTRYQDSRSIGMWELINEPETSDCTGYIGTGCYGHQTCADHGQAARVLRQFFDTVGGEIKHIDPNHLIESGVIGSGQCGSDNANYVYVHQSPSIDVASYHDYGDDTSPLPGDQWNGLQARLSQMKKIGKPLIVGEAGILAVKSGTHCVSLDERKNEMKKKMDAMFGAGIAGFIPWNRSPGADTACNYDIGNQDPLVDLINTYQLSQ